MAGLPAHAAPERLKEIRIGDSKGDWGLPTPWRHYPRGPGYLRMSWIFETLLWKNERGPVPALAESWSWDEKTLSYTFRIRKGVKWHDGHPLTADDCAFTIRYMKKHPYSWAKLGLVADASAPDAQTLVVKMKKAFAPFPDVVAGTMPIIPKHVGDGRGSEGIRRTRSLHGHGPLPLQGLCQGEGHLPLRGERRLVGGPSRGRSPPLREDQKAACRAHDG